ncbi:hypothetical protein [Rhizobium sp. BK491]|nr:hypothetical protein [Rhizobium sp. BK491]MBB3571045.1 hypothetical protein [Rhizobium sp. BK491]
MLVARRAVAIDRESLRASAVRIRFPAAAPPGGAVAAAAGGGNLRSNIAR